MSRKSQKGDIEIGWRAAEEVNRLLFRHGGTVASWSRQAGLTPQDVGNWRMGLTPGGAKLARLPYAGADVIYILTGRRSEGVNNA